MKEIGKILSRRQCQIPVMEDLFLTPLAPMSHRGGTPLMPSPEWTVLATYSYLGCATSLLRWLCKWCSLSYVRGQEILYSIGEKELWTRESYMPFFHSIETRTLTNQKNSK